MDAITRMRCFIQVVDSNGFSAAAREMGRSKALVSKYVGELEDELGVPVVTSNQATFWHVLRTLGLEDQIPGYGRLLADC